ncbi:MAG: response regulator receiver protein [Deltaproteobacteria bacterium]|nr:response regulator receiver protein [Deltaproteobacteria bacterium]
MATVSKRVIIGDPVDKHRQALALFLREKGMEVIEAPDGSRALAETLLRKPDVLLLDLSVPILGPDRLVQILRSNPNTRDMPIFFLSDQERSITGFRPGVDQFLRRPFQEEEVLQRIQRFLYKDPFSEVLAGDSEISGNLSQFFIPDLWQMLSMNRKSGILQVEGEHLTGSIYIERGEIVSASTQNLVGEKALFRMIPLKEGKFSFLPGKAGVRRTIYTPNQHTILEGLRHDDELRRIGDALPSPNDFVAVVKDTKEISPSEGAVREVLLLAGFCSRVEDIVNNCHFPDLVVYKALLSLKERGILSIGPDDEHPARSEFLPPGDLSRIGAKLIESAAAGDDGIWRIVFFLPDPTLVEELVLALGKFRDFEVDRVFFSLRAKEGIPMGTFGRLRLADNCSIFLHAFPYQRSASPLWYSLAPSPLGIIVFLKDGLTGSLENLMSVSEFTRGTSTRALLALTGKGYSEAGLGENTLRLFRNRIERLGASLKVREMEQVTSGEIRDSLVEVIRQSLEGEPT